MTIVLLAVLSLVVAEIDLGLVRGCVDAEVAEDGVNDYLEQLRTPGLDGPNYMISDSP